MPKNLTEKISLLLDDSKDLQRYELIRVIEKLIMEELHMLSIAHKIDAYDLTLVKSNAIKMYVDSSFDEEKYGRSIAQDHDMKRAYCYVAAVIALLRGKGLINFTLEYDKKSNRW